MRKLFDFIKNAIALCCIFTLIVLIHNPYSLWIPGLSFTISLTCLLLICIPSFRGLASITDLGFLILNMTCQFGIGIFAILRIKGEL